MPRWSKKTIPKPDYYLRLKDIRNALGINMNEMAAIIGIPQVTYLNYQMAP